jgi:hypothetical protein
MEGTRVIRQEGARIIRPEDNQVQDDTLILGDPPKVLFAAQIDGRLKIGQPFDAKITIEDHTVTALVPDIEEFGCGSTLGEALYDLGKTIAELYFTLDAEKDRLSSDLQAVRGKLAAHIQRVHE